MGWLNFLTELFDFTEYDDLKIKLLILVGFLILAILAILIFILIHKIKERKIRVVKEEQEEPEDINLLKIKKLKTNRKNPREDLLSLKNIVRDYLKEHYSNINAQASLGETAKNLREKNKTKFADFCDKISYYLYSGEEITKQNIDNLINEFETLTKQKKLKPKTEIQEKERTEVQGKIKALLQEKLIAKVEAMAKPKIKEEGKIKEKPEKKEKIKEKPEEKREEKPREAREIKKAKETRNIEEIIPIRRFEKIKLKKPSTKSIKKAWGTGE